MTQNSQPEGAITRQIREAQERIDRLIAQRQQLSDRIQSSVNESKSTNQTGNK